MRLDKFLANATGLTRSQVKKSIKNGEVCVNDEPVFDVGLKIDPEQDSIEFDDNEISSPQPRYYMLNKPKDVVCATKDDEHQTVLDILFESDIYDTENLKIAGRLDKDTTGLLLITDDGQWLHRVSSGKKSIGKTYIADLDRAVSLDEQKRIIEEFKAGILLKSELKPTKPAEAEFISDTRVEVTLHEGRYHQVKRMFGYFGFQVVELHRYKIEALILDDTLELGEARALNQDEIALFN